MRHMVDVEKTAGLLGMNPQAFFSDVLRLKPVSPGLTVHYVQGKPIYSDEGFSKESIERIGIFAQVYGRLEHLRRHSNLPKWLGSKNPRLGGKTLIEALKGSNSEALSALEALDHVEHAIEDAHLQ